MIFVLIVYSIINFVVIVVLHKNKSYLNVILSIADLFLFLFKKLMTNYRLKLAGVFYHILPINEKTIRYNLCYDASKYLRHIRHRRPYLFY